MRRFFPFAILIAAVFAAYGLALKNGFVWDDTALVLRDPLIRSPLLLGEGWHHFLFIDATPSAFYRPLQRVLYTLVYAIAGFQPWLFHVASILVHAGAACAFYGFARRFCERFAVPRAEQVSFVSALVWAVHPIHSSAVIYIAGLADPIAAFLGFSGLALLMAEQWLLAGVCLGSAVFGKEGGVMFAPIGLGLAILLTAKARQWRKLATVAVPMLLMIGLYAGLRFSAQKTAPPVEPPVPTAVRPILALRAVAEYAGLVAAPINLRMERDVTTRTGGEVQSTLAAARLREFQTLLGAALVCALVYWFRKASFPERICLLAALAAYLPISNVFTLNATVAEHWIYVPSAFLFLAAALSLESKLRRNPYRAVAVAACGVWVLALTVRTALRCGDWKDQRTFLEATIGAGGDSARMFSNLASLQMGEGDLTDAVANFRTALAKRPDQPFAMLGLAGALLRQGNYDEARQLLAKCEKIPLVRAETLVDEAVLEYKQAGKDRVDLLKQASEVDPHFWPLRKRYIGHLLERKEYATAAHELRDQVAAEPYRAETWEMLGRTMELIGNQSLAQQAFSEADLRDWHRGETNRQPKP